MKSPKPYRGFTVLRADYGSHRWTAEKDGSRVEFETKCRVGSETVITLRSLFTTRRDRINRHDSRFGAGRKWDSDWQRDAYRTAREVNTPRLIVRWVPRDFEERLRHRVRRYEDD